MQLKIQEVREFQTVQVCTFKTTFRIGKMTAYGGSELLICSMHQWRIPILNGTWVGVAVVCWCL